jgi:hypothetical protein
LQLQRAFQETLMATRTALACATALFAALGSLAPLPCGAQSPESQDYAATIYFWIPDIGIDTTFSGSGGSSVDVTGSDILNALNFTFMGSLEARHGRWGVVTDLIYADFSDSTNASRALSVGGVGLPAGVSGKASLGISGWLWTTVGTYRLLERPDCTMDLLAGARLLALTETLDWRLTGDLGDPPLLDQAGHSRVSDDLWDGIVGLRGQMRFGSAQKWFAMYYADVGTGQSDLTWQGALGAGYSFGWGDAIAAWRYLYYRMTPYDAIDSAWLNGPAIGVRFHF